LQRLSPHGLHWPTVDEGLDTAALHSVSLMLLSRRNATTGGSGNNMVSVSLFQFLSNDDGQCLTFSLRGMVIENKGNPFVDLFFFVLQEVISLNFTGL
jgi:hypothetical protein